MTGPEHYREAERLSVDASKTRVSVDHPNPAYRSADKVASIVAGLNARAQVHATLALAAATAEAIVQSPARPGADSTIQRAWSKAIS